ncbi:MAG: 50S ribosomal protein L11 methyltransferase [Hyphomicrobiaceae bacterium]
MPQQKLVIRVARRDHAHRLGALLTDIIEPGADALTLFEDGDGWRIEAYFAEMPDAAACADALADLSGLSRPEVAIEDVPDENWVAISQAALPPVEAGRFRVHGSHDRWRVPQGPGAIEIDAGEAFGTAHHATTAGCLLAISRADVLEARAGRRFANVLDLGTGSGVLAVALARVLRRARITASDLDRRSVEVAAANIRSNGAAGRVATLVAGGFDDPRLASGRRFDLIVANILAGPLVRLAGDVARRLAPRGMLILSGILVPQAAGVIAAYSAYGITVVDHRRLAGWSTITLQKRC